MMFGNASALTAFPGRGRCFVKRNAAKAPLGRRAAKGIAAILLALCLLLPTAVAGETAQAVLGARAVTAMDVLDRLRIE